MYKKKTLQKIYEKVDLEKILDHYHIKITGRHGPWLRMACLLPSHNDSSPSANFNSETGIYKCFVCGSKSFFTVIKELENLSSFWEAVEFVCKKVGYEDDGHYIDDLIEDLSSLQNEIVDEDNIKIIDIDLSIFEDANDHYDMVKSRVNNKMIDYWKLKYATKGYYKGRLIMPITIDNRTVSFCARDMTKRSAKWMKLLKHARKDNLTVTELDELRSKYECKKILYPPVIVDEPKTYILYGSSIGSLMFNFENAVLWNSEYVILVEGAFDAMKLFSWGFNAVAILGTKLSGFNRTRLLENFDKVYMALDNDEKADGTNPGQDAAEKIIAQLRNKIDTYNILLPLGKDPDECVMEEFKTCFDSAEYFC